MLPQAIVRRRLKLRLRAPLFSTPPSNLTTSTTYGPSSVTSLLRSNLNLLPSKLQLAASFYARAFEHCINLTVPSSATPASASHDFNAPTPPETTPAEIPPLLLVPVVKSILRICNDYFIHQLEIEHCIPREFKSKLRDIGSEQFRNRPVDFLR
jgi:hypothetical protein